MEFIYIANSRAPTEKAHGLQIFKTLEALSLSYKNIKITLILPRRLNGIKKDPFDYYGVRRVFEIKKLPCLDLINLFGKTGFIIENLSFAFFCFLYVFFKKRDSVIYGRDIITLYLFLFSKKKIFFEAHTVSKFFFLYTPLFKKISRVFATTEGLKNVLTGKGVPAEKIIVLPDGADIEKFNVSDTTEEARKKLNLPQNKKIILYSGHLYKWKGAETLLASAALFKADKDVLFVFAGGTDKDILDFKKKVKRLELRNVLIAGHRPHCEIPLWLRAADILILPNSGKEKISVFYTSPLKMFEYMAAKKPIIASDLPSIREALDGTSAVFAEADNPESFAQAIKKVLQNGDLSYRISNNAFCAAKNYTWEKRAQKIIDFITRDL